MTRFEDVLRIFISMPMPSSKVVLHELLILTGFFESLIARSLFAMFFLPIGMGSHDCDAKTGLLGSSDLFLFLAEGHSPHVHSLFAIGGVLKS